MVDIDAMRDLAQEVANEWGTLPDDVGLLEADFPALKELLGDVIPIIATVREPRGFATVHNIERMIDVLFDVTKIVEYAPADYIGRDVSGVPVVEYKESPVLDIKIKSEPKTVSSGISKTTAPDVVKRPAISSRLLDVSPLAAELVSVKEREGAVLSLSHTPEEYLAGVNDVTKSLLSDLQSIKGMVPADDNAMIYVPDDVIAGIREKSAALGALIGTVQDTGGLLQVKPETIAGLTGFAEELKRAEMLAATQDQYLHIQTVEESDKIPPEDVEGQRKAAEDALNRLWKGSPGDAANKALAYHFPGLAGAIISGDIDGNKLYESIRFYNAVEQGQASEIQLSRFGGSSGIDPYTRRDSFKSVDMDEKKARLSLLWKETLNDTASPYVALVLVSQLVDNLEDDGAKEELTSWLETGGLDQAVQEDSGWAIQMEIRDFALTPEGQATGALLFTGAVAILSAGLGLATLAVGSVATGIFAATEVPNLVNFLKSGEKAGNVDSGRDPSTVAYNYDGSYKSSKSLVDDLIFNKEDMSAEERKTALEEAKKSYDALGKQLFNDWWALSSTGKYDAALKEYNDLGALLGRQSKGIDTSTGELVGSAKVEPRTVNVAVPVGMNISYKGEKLPEGKTTAITEPEGTIASLTASQPGYHSKVVDLKFYGEGNSDVSIALEEDWSAGAKALRENVGEVDYRDETDFFGLRNLPEKESKEQGWTLKLNPGQKAEFAGKEYAASDDRGAGFIFFDEPGKPLSIKFTNPDGAVDVLNTFIPEEGYLVAQKEIAPSFLSELEKSAAKQKEIADAKALAESVSYVVPTLTKGQVLYIDGKRVTPPADGSPIQVLPGDHSYVIKENGKQDVIGSFKVFGGDTYSVAGAGKAPYVSSGSGGGGGGGSSGGSRSSYTPTVKPAEPQTGFIKFTAAIEGASIELDNQEIAPGPGQSYEIAYGYHFLNILMPGKKAWAKQIYIGKGDTLTVSPLFEDLEVEEEEIPPVVTLPEKKRVYINSNPSGAKVTINGTATGEWSPCYLDLLPGYYIVGFIKSGYAESQIALLVGDSISWGDLATSLAKMAGLV